MRRYAGSADGDFECVGVIFAHSALGVKYVKLAPVSAIAVSDGGSSAGGRSVGAIIGGGIITPGDAAGITRGGLHIRLEILK